MPNFDGIQYLFTVPVGLAAGLAVSLALALVIGASWWLLAPPAVGFWIGVKAGNHLAG